MPIERLRNRLQNLAVPVPACYAEWQAKRNLPAGPEGAVFHPLPARPMFQPRPSDNELWTSQAEVVAMGGVGVCDYGQMPRGVQWHTRPLGNATVAGDTTSTRGSVNEMPSEKAEILQDLPRPE